MPYVETPPNEQAQRPAWPLQEKGNRDKHVLTAVVKGAGPAALSAAITLAKSGYRVQVAALRSAATPARSAVITFRPNVAQYLDQTLDSFSYLEKRNMISILEDQQILDETLPDKNAHMNGLDFDLRHYKPGPARLGAPANYAFRIGDLEAALTHTARSLGVTVHEESTIKLTAVPSTHRMHATLISKTGAFQDIDLGFPDLIVCASGKGDTSLPLELNIPRLHGLKITDANLPAGGSRFMQLGPAGEMEAQDWVNVSFRIPKDTSFITSGTKSCFRYYGNLEDYAGAGEQKVFEFILRWKASDADVGEEDNVLMCLILPRGFDPDDMDAIKARALGRFNWYTGANYGSWAELEHMVNQKDRIRPYKCETCCLPTFVYGSNVVVIGDAAASCSGLGSLGAEIAVYDDNKVLATLAEDLQSIQKAKVEGEERAVTREQALDAFNRGKAENIVLWTKISGQLYLTSEEGNKIVEAVRLAKAEAGMI